VNDMRLINETQPIARKEHICMFCGGKIEKGQRYIRQTLENEYIYDFICHKECQAVANDTDMYEDCDPDEGLTEDMFCESIDQYIYDNHYDDEIDDIAVEWQNLTMYDKVLKIIDELDK